MIAIELFPVLVAVVIYGLTLLTVGRLARTRPEARVLLRYASLLVPAAAAALALAHLHADLQPASLNNWLCLPLWSLTAMGILAVGFAAGFFWEQVRLERQLRVWSEPAEGVLAAAVAPLAAQMGLTGLPRVYLVAVDAPLALTIGVLRPRIYLSSWLVERLSAVEIEQVLAHELAHIARSDNLIALVATALMGATAFLPTSWQAVRALLRERELAADELAVAVTGKPIALARGLLKAGVPDHPAFAAAAGLLEAGSITERVDNLLRLHSSRPERTSPAQWREKTALMAMTALGPLALTWFVFDLPHLLQLP
ncbi:MAG: M56 family metallopeptidase [Aphanocapsa lilacina HA4352-LM1]|jgi:Zn-dependent protease with chaperone function|nr:M56 family metallopeptidase [Aphanocapsa lilacina HA4352-LM1]